MSERPVLPPRMERRLGIAERMRHDNEWAHSYWTDVRDLERRLIGAGRVVQDDGLDVERLARALERFYWAFWEDTIFHYPEKRAEAAKAIASMYCAAPPLHDPQEPKR